jgi:hypothetical protein
MGEAKVAWAEYDTPHDGTSRPCKGTILSTDDGFVLRERIQVGVDAKGSDMFEERSRVLLLPEAQKVLNDWIGLEIAEVVQIPWD